MATSITGGKRPYTGARGLTIASVQFKANSTSDPLAANTQDPCGVVKSITRVGTGQYKITLNGKYRRIHMPTPHGMDSGIARVQVSTSPSSTADNSVTLTAYNTGFSQADSTVDFQAVLYLYAHE